MSFRIGLDGRGAGQAFDAFEAFAEARLQRAMLAATHRGGVRLKSAVRERMQAAGLGRLGNAIEATSDQTRGAGVHPLPGGGFSASGLLYVRTGSKRTRGALEAYFQGADIRPRRGRWLWVPTDEIRRRASDKTRLTPATWASSGLEAKIGPLTLVKNVNGRPLLVVKNVGTTPGKSRSAKSLTKTGRLRKGQVGRDFVVAFIAIPATSRAARIDINAIHREVMADLPALLASELRRA